MKEPSQDNGVPGDANGPIEPESNLNETIERIVGVVARRRWWILVPACCIPVVVVAVAMRLPNRFVSQATLMVVQQQVSQRFVQPDSTTTVAAAIQAMKLEVLSAGRLLKIINDLGLYAADEERRIPDLLVDKLRKDIEIEPLETTAGLNDFNAITIAFTAPNPRLAQEVTSRLTSLFIEQNLRARGEQAANTTKFLSDQLDAARQRLAQQEQRLQAFKTGNLGELPEQQQANLAGLGDARERQASVTASLLQAKQEQASVESMLNDRLTRLQTERAELLIRYTPQYPAVVKKDREIASVQAVLNRLRTSSPASGPGQNSELPDDPGLIALIRQAEKNASTLENLLEQQRKVQAESEQYQRHLNLAPLREQQLAEILRDYDLFKQDYANLQKEKLQSEMTTTLEVHQEGQQFRLVDPPSLPLRPSGPNRLKICVGGMAGALLVGFILAFFIEMRDSSFHGEKMLVKSLNLPLVLGVPLVRTTTERRARGWRLAFEWFFACVMTITMLAAELYVFRKGSI